jgi:DNA-binding NtrC family response regulator
MNSPYKKIVICEDDVKTQRDLRIICNTNHSKIIQEFQTGADLINWLKEFPNEPDLIILDIIMKKMDGFVAFHEIQKINPKIPIIIVSIENSVPLVKYLVFHGAKDFITKPYELEQLRKRILRFIVR